MAVDEEFKIVEAMAIHKSLNFNLYIWLLSDI